MEHTKAYQEFKKNGNTKFVRYLQYIISCMQHNTTKVANIKASQGLCEAGL